MFTTAAISEDMGGNLTSRVPGFRVPGSAERHKRSGARRGALRPALSGLLLPANPDPDPASALLHPIHRLDGRVDAVLEDRKRSGREGRALFMGDGLEPFAQAQRCRRDRTRGQTRRILGRERVVPNAAELGQETVHGRRAGRWAYQRPALLTLATPSYTTWPSS